MQPVFRSLQSSLVAGAIVAASALLAAPAAAADYSLLSPAVAPDVEAAPAAPVLADWGPLRLSRTFSNSGKGLSLQAGERWFARADVGRTVLERDALSIGGGYRFNGGDTVSMHLTRQAGDDRLGLAVRYDWTRTYLRLSYEGPPHPAGNPERLRLSAGIRF